MKKKVVFLLVLIQMSIVAQTVQVVNREESGDNLWLRPTIKLTNSSTTTINLSNVTFDYYFYESGLSSSDFAVIIWSFSKNAAQPSFSNSEITATVTAHTPAYTSGTKKANFRVRLTCNVNTRTLAQNDYTEISFGIRRSDYSALTKTDDYSYTGSATYAANTNIVVSNSGTIIAGVAPGGGTVTKLPMKWTGAYSTAPTPEDGDVYFNNTDKKAYVYSNPTWNILSNGMWQTETNGISYKAGTVTTTKLVSDRVEVKEVVVTPKWQIANTPPDYVFEKDYKLSSLENVEKFIKENGHLNDMPSAKEFMDNGVNLVDMNMKLLKKVEELTLYTIQLNKQIAAISDSLGNVSKKVSDK